jgi:hypothetical protein
MPAETQYFLALRFASRDARSAHLRSSSFGGFACMSSEAAKQRRRKARGPRKRTSPLPAIAAIRTLKVSFEGSVELCCNRVLRIARNAL